MKARGHKNMLGRCGTTMTRIGRFAIKIVGGAGIALMESTTEHTFLGIRRRALII